MSEDLETAPAAPTAGPAAEPPRAPSNRRGGLAWIVALLALAVAGAALWRTHVAEQAQADAAAAIGSRLEARIDELARAADLRKRELDSLRARMSDADGVNKSVREELLALAERSRHLEDAVANLAERHRSGRDALAMNEAEFLLQLAAERLALFHDAHGAVTAYGLADSALAAAEDPVFASVRQTIGAERQALEASKPLETRAALDALERLRAGLAQLPPPKAAADAPAEPSRWQRFLSQFVRISHDGAPGPLQQRDAGLARSLIALDLREAEAALLARDADACKAALARARAGIEAASDPAAAPTRAALAELDRLAAAPFAPALPELGSALRELRNLRATRALSQPSPSGPAQAEPARSEDGT
jgi:uroporphyrin-3 C-methyltransferase